MPDEFWDRGTISASRCRRALEAIGADPDSFATAYEDLPQTRKDQGVTPAQVKAVAKYEKHGDLGILRNELGGITRAIAQGIIVRVLGHRAMLAKVDAKLEKRQQGART